MDLLSIISAASGLGSLQKDLVSNWIGPVLFIAVAGIAIKFIISRQFRELAAFLGIAAVVGLLVFNSSFLFGDTGIFSGIAKSFSKQVGGTATPATPATTGKAKTGTINYISNVQNMGSYEIEFPKSK